MKPRGRRGPTPTRCGTQVGSRKNTPHLRSHQSHPVEARPIPCAATPVFVFGLPRCGYTLLESKLASRNGVTALGEDSSLLRAAHALPGGWPKGAAELQKSTRPEGWWSESEETTTFVDKNLFNHLVLPFILHVLPNARFIHLRRNQADTLLSCFAEPLPARLHPWTTSPGRLSQYAALHNDLMSHWSKQMPTEQWLEVSYESMVQDMDATLHRWPVCWNQRRAAEINR